MGNIGNAILNEKKITKKTIFVIEISSYQIEYSRNFKANYAAILNLSPDHLERHGNFSNYIKTKFKLVTNQKNKNYAFFDKKNKYLKKFLNKKSLNPKIINVGKKSYIKEINLYFQLQIS